MFRIIGALKQNINNSLCYTGLLCPFLTDVWEVCFASFTKTWWTAVSLSLIARPSAKMSLASRVNRWGEEWCKYFFIIPQSWEENIWFVSFFSRWLFFRWLVYGSAGRVKAKVCHKSYALGDGGCVYTNMTEHVLRKDVRRGLKSAWENKCMCVCTHRWTCLYVCEGIRRSVNPL